MDGLKEVERLVAFLRQVELQDHAGVVLPQHLGLGVGELLVHVLQVLFDIVIQGEVSRLLLVVDEEAHRRLGRKGLFSAVRPVPGSTRLIPGEETDDLTVGTERKGSIILIDPPRAGLPGSGDPRA